MNLFIDRKRFIFLVYLICFSLYPILNSVRAENLLIFAASSVALPMQKIAHEYEHRTSTKIRISFAASSILARQISRGAPADIFISANRKWMSFLADKYPVIAKSRRKILSNRLVVISRLNTITPLKNLRKDWFAGHDINSRIAIGDPDHVPAGIYGKQALTNLKLWGAIKNRLTRLTNARAVLNLVERGEALTGIVYKSDAHTNNNVQIIYNFPEDTHDKISYWASIARKNSHLTALDVFSVIFNNHSKSIFRTHGFIVK